MKRMSRGNVFKLSGNMALGGNSDYHNADIEDIKNSLKLLKSKQNQKRSNEPDSLAYGYSGSKSNFYLMKIKATKITMILIHSQKIICLVKRKFHLEIMVKIIQMISARNTKIMVEMTMISTVNHPPTHNKAITNQRRMFELKNMMNMIMNIQIKKVQAIPPAHSTTPNNLKGKDNPIILKNPTKKATLKKMKKVSRKLIEKIKSKLDNMILLNLKNVEWVVVECSTLKVLLSMKKIVKKFSKKKESNLIHKNIELLPQNKNNS